MDKNKNFFEGYKTSKFVIARKKEEARERFRRLVIELDICSDYRMDRFIKNMFGNVTSHMYATDIVVGWRGEIVTVKYWRPFELIDDDGKLLATGSEDIMMYFYDLHPEAATIALSRMDEY